MAIASLAKIIRNVPKNMFQMDPANGKCSLWKSSRISISPIAENVSVHTRSLPARAVTIELPEVYSRCLEVPYLSSAPNEYIRTIITIISSTPGSRTLLR